MKKNVFFVLLILCMIFAGCQDTIYDDITIVNELNEDFESYTVGQTLQSDYILHECVTSYSGGDNYGLYVNNELDNQEVDNFLVFMLDNFGPEFSFGENYLGYNYFQIYLYTVSNGTLLFDYYQEGWNPGPDPIFTLSFWKNFTGDIATAEDSDADWTNNVYTERIFLTCSIPLTTGLNRLTWKVKKIAAAQWGYEDEIYIDNIIFTPNE